MRAFGVFFRWGTRLTASHGGVRQRAWHMKSWGNLAILVPDFSYGKLASICMSGGAYTDDNTDDDDR